MGAFEAMKQWIGGSKVFMSMIMLQLFSSGFQLLTKVSFGKGMYIFAYISYRQVIGALCIAPFAFFFERHQPMTFTWRLLFWLFISALTGMTGNIGLYSGGLRDTTAAYAVNFLNLLPIFTFIFSTIARIEKLRLNTMEGKFKILGAILCVGGALTVGLFKGKNLVRFGHPKVHDAIKLSKDHWTRGTFLLVGSILSNAIWFLVQVKLQTIFPFKFTSTMLASLLSSLQSMVLGLSIDRRKTLWQLEWNVQLVTILYAGALNTAAVFCVNAWVIKKRGPTYPSMFNALSLIFTTFLEAFIFGEPITLGSLLGSLVITTGLYTFVWAKLKEHKKLQAEAEAQAQAHTNVQEIIDVVEETVMVNTGEYPQETDMVDRLSSEDIEMVDAEPATDEIEMV